MNRYESHIAYGPIQRRLAGEFHVTLIPKRFLIEVLSGTDATSDGLHLAAAGAEKMARLMASVLAGILPEPATRSTIRR